MMTVQRDKYTIHFAEEVLSILNTFKGGDMSKEVGGIILGTVSESNEIVISKLSLPNRYDKASKYSFERDRNIAQIIIDYEVHNSHGKIIYLGEWHTHPENNPIPSSVDVKMIQWQFRDNSLNEAFLIMLIQGRESLYTSIYDGHRIYDC